jgi:hypothetical protein
VGTLMSGNVVSGISVSGMLELLQSGSMANHSASWVVPILIVFTASCLIRRISPLGRIIAMCQASRKTDRPDKLVFQLTFKRGKVAVHAWRMERRVRALIPEILQSTNGSYRKTKRKHYI